MSMCPSDVAERFRVLLPQLFVVTLCLLLSGLAPSRVSAETLSNNLNAPTAYTELISGTQWVSASFGTGGSAYTLAEITLLMQSDGGGTAGLALYSDSNGTPGVQLGSLQTPTAFSSVLTPTSFGGNSLTLTADTTYWAVLRPISGTTEWAYTDDNTGSGSGFQNTWAISYDGGSGWYTSDSQPMQMRVDGNPSGATPEPGSAFLLLLGAVLTGAAALRRKFSESSRSQRQRS